MTESFDEAFLFLHPAADPAADRIVHEHGGARTLLAWAPDAPAAARLAAELADRGVRLIELYRGFGLPEAALVIEAVGGRAPVGVASSALGATRPDARSWATVYTDDEAAADGVHVVREHRDGSRTTVVGAPEATMPAVVAALVRSGVEVVEICGGTPLTTAARVAAATGGDAVVGLVSWPFESIEDAAAFKAAFEARTR
ncbi:DUF6506 family protein [Phytohabitans houttuyneae]|uniref:Uncharacterized protein n=1 Tax=Phytohabitans houttuyneae TaxID=1076126 RepID=A0A6V8KV30_9ACTN|nr:DUF6506 family protein [Phytohabitans houttuyneae]GFJ86251.1 hypothetical protein Phou_104310 [Phytohabitans houttuyneae]